MSADTAAFDRLFSKEAAFTTATIDTSTFLNVRTPQITSPTADLLISVSGTVTMNAELFTTNGLFLDQASTAGQIFTGTTIGDKLIYCATEDLYIGPTAVSTNLFLRGTGVAIGSNFYPQAPATNGYVLTQSSPGILQLLIPSSNFSSGITTPTIATSGDMTIDPVGFLFLDSSSTRLNFSTYISAGSGTLGGNGFPSVTVPVGGSAIRGDFGTWIGSSGGLLAFISSAGQRITANGRVLDQTNYATYGGSAPMPSAATTYKPGSGLIQSTGTILDYNASNGAFTNNTGFTILVTASYSCRRDSNLLGAVGFGFELNGAGVRIGRTDVAGIDWSSGFAMFQLLNGETFSLVSTQTEADNTYHVDSRLYYSYVKNAA